MKVDKRRVKRDRELGRYRIQWVVPARGDCVLPDVETIQKVLLRAYGADQPLRVTSIGYEVLAYDPEVDEAPVVLARVFRPFPPRAFISDRPPPYQWKFRTLEGPFQRFVRTGSFQ